MSCGCSWRASALVERHRLLTSPFCDTILPTSLALSAALAIEPQKSIWITRSLLQSNMERCTAVVLMR